MSLIKANSNISVLPSSAISNRVRRRKRGRSGSSGGGGRVTCLMMAGSGVSGREEQGGVIEGEETPSGRKWGSKELFKG